MFNQNNYISLNDTSDNDILLYYRDSIVQVEGLGPATIAGQIGAGVFKAYLLHESGVYIPTKLRKDDIRILDFAPRTGYINTRYCVKYLVKSADRTAKKGIHRGTYHEVDVNPGTKDILDKLPNKINCSVDVTLSDFRRSDIVNALYNPVYLTAEQAVDLIIKGKRTGAALSRFVALRKTIAKTEIAVLYKQSLIGMLVADKSGSAYTFSSDERNDEVKSQYGYSCYFSQVEKLLGGVIYVNN